jgi:hypothetical protein
MSNLVIATRLLTEEYFKQSVLDIVWEFFAAVAHYCVKYIRLLFVFFTKTESVLVSQCDICLDCFTVY